MGMGQVIDINEFVRQIEKAVAGGVATLDNSSKIPKSQIDLTASDVGAIATETDPTVSSFTKGLTTNDSILTALNAASGLISSNRLPSYVDDVLSYVNLAGFPVLGDTGKIYVAEDTNKIYRWSGSSYIEISSAATADTALKLSTPRTITATGDASYSVSFDGSVNVLGELTLANSGVVVGTYNALATQNRPFTVDAKGRITAVGTPVDITPPWSAITSKPTTLSGFGITDAQPLGGELTALQALPNTTGFLRKIGVGSYSIDTASYLSLTGGTVVGTVTATAFSGSGASLTTLNATNLSSGTVADARLSNNVGLLTGDQTFSGAKTFSAVTTFSNTTASTSPTTGGVVFGGGIGIAEHLYAGGNLNYVGDITGGTIRTWTPTLEGAVSNPTVTYTVQLGEYIKIGRLIVANFYVTYSSFSGGSGAVKISLPVATKSPIVSQMTIGSVSYSSDLIFQKSIPRIAGANSLFCLLKRLDFATDLLISEIPASGTIICSVGYFI